MFPPIPPITPALVIANVVGYLLEWLLPEQILPGVAPWAARPPAPPRAHMGVGAHNHLWGDRAVAGCHRPAAERCPFRASGRDAGRRHHDSPVASEGPWPNNTPLTDRRWRTSPARSGSRPLTG